MLFGKRSSPQHAHTDHDSLLTRASAQGGGEGLEAEYEDIVRAQLTKLGVPLETVAVEVRSPGTMPDGRQIYLGMVRLVEWHARTSLRLLVALPFLEAKTRQSLETSWLTDVSHFGGLWVHASSALRSDEVLGDIREAVRLLELNAVQSQAAAEEGWSASVQAALVDTDPRRG